MEAFPLYWPEGWKRTAYTVRSAFKTGFGAARIKLSEEIVRMGASGVIISTNVPLRNDGMPRASAPEPKDKGVAVYFKRKGKDMVFACDKFDRTQDNIYAIAKTIEALRGIERWGASDMMERAFSGFKQLTSGEKWWEVLEVDADATLAHVNASFRRLAMVAHPDRGGSQEQMSRLNLALAEAKTWFGL